jgi:[acyl-carrier-protein] S-malonyltransferase
MAAVNGLIALRVEHLCGDVSALGICEVTNYNAPDQTVIGGDEKAVLRAMELAIRAGAENVVRLRVSAPFHTSLMLTAAEELAVILADFPIRNPAYPIVANLHARPIEGGGDIRLALIGQVASPVRWLQTVERMLQEGVTVAIELGPGTTVSGLIKRTTTRIRTLHVEDDVSLHEALDAISQYPDGA